MFDFRLRVFQTVAKRLSFTKAATELYITQPAVTKHIRELEGHFKASLFERSGNRKIVLTPAGKLLLEYTGKLLSIYSDMEFDMNLLVQKHSGILRIGASTTVAQYIIPPILAQFHSRFNQVKVSLITGNTTQVEDALLNKEIDLGIIEGLPGNFMIRYDEYLKDELVLVTTSSNSQVKKDTIKPEELKNYPIVLREHGSGTLDVIMNALNPYQIKLRDLQVEMQLGGSESIKSYLLHSNCFAFLSVHSILKELKSNECRIIDIKDLSIERPFYFIQLQGQPSSLAEQFMRFAKSQST